MKKYVGYKEGYDRVFNSENADKMKEGGKAGKKQYIGKYNHV